MRRIIKSAITALVLTLVFSILTACSTTSSGSDQSEKEKTLTFWTHNSGPMVEQTKELIEKYEAENPHITIDYQSMPNDQFAEKTVVALGTSTGPDVLLVSDRNIPTFVSKGVLKPVDPEAFGFDNLEGLMDDWIGSSLDGLMQDEQLYAIPMEFNSFNLFINTKAFEEAGLDPEQDIPKTWDELAEVASKLTIREDGRLVQAGFAWPMFNGGWEALVIDPMVRQLGGSLIEDYGTEAYFDSPEVQQVFQTWQDMYHQYEVMDIGFGTHSAANPNQSFIDSQLAMWISGPWAIPMITKESEVYEHYKVAPLPSYDPNHPVTTLYSWNWAVNSETQYPEEAWKFVNYLSSHQKEWLENAGYIQPRKGWLDDPDVQEFPYMDVWEKGMENGHYILRSDKYNEIIDLLERTVDVIMNEKKPVEEVLEKTQKEAEKILKDQ